MSASSWFRRGRPRLHGAEGVAVGVETEILALVGLIGQGFRGGRRFVRAENVGEVVFGLFLFRALHRDFFRGLGLGDGVRRRVALGGRLRLGLL